LGEISFSYFGILNALFIRYSHDKIKSIFLKQTLAPVAFLGETPPRHLGLSDFYAFLCAAESRRARIVPL